MLFTQHLFIIIAVGVALITCCQSSTTAETEESLRKAQKNERQPASRVERSADPYSDDEPPPAATEPRKNSELKSRVKRTRVLPYRLVRQASPAIPVGYPPVPDSNGYLPAVLVHGLIGKGHY
ncbi:hypothetical protein MRX96_040341 [Rhipicephalus microplus]